MTYLIENENAALVVPARHLGQVHPHYREVQQALALQCADEARHVEVFTRRLALRGHAPMLSTAGGQASLQSLLQAADFSSATFLLSVLGEGSFVNLLNFLHEHAPDPVTRQICRLAARDEARHGGAYLRYMKKALTRFGNEAKAAFAKVGVLMASARRTAQALHPTNLHVNATLFPHDTIQSRVPDPDWLEGWLDKQIQFDAVWENKVVERILHNMSLLLERSFVSVQELNRYRKEVTALVVRAVPPAAPDPQVV